MKRNLILSIISCMFLLANIQLCYGQGVEENENVRNCVDSIFENLDKSKIPNGLLRDYSFELVDLDQFTGTSTTCNNPIDRPTYELLLRTIKSCAVSTAPFGDVAGILVDQNNAGNDNTVSLSAMAYQYSYIKQNAITDNLIKYVDGKVSDNFINNVWQNPYGSQYATGLCAQDSVFGAPH